MAELQFPEHECVIATHTDTKTVHSHIVVNAVNPITGRKLHITSDEYGRMKDEENRIGKNMVSVMPNGGRRQGSSALLARSISF